MHLIATTCYFNEVFNVYFKIKDCSWNDWTMVEEKTKKVNGGTYRLTKYQYEDLVFYTFGFLTDDLNQRPGHGGEWSSNEDNIKEQFGVELLGIGLDGIAVSVTYDELFKYLNPDVYVRTAHEIETGVDSKTITKPEYHGWYDNNGNLMPKKRMPTLAS